MRIWTNWGSCNCSSPPRRPCKLEMKRLQESRIVEISIYGLMRGVEELNLHSYSTRRFQRAQKQLGAAV